MSIGLTGQHLLSYVS